MKWLAATVLAGCAAPTGVPQDWPPRLGITISAAAFGDFTGSGQRDIAIAATGGAAGEGLYLVAGGADWDGARIASFTRFVPHRLAALGALVSTADGGLALAYSVKGKVMLEALAPATLATTTVVALDLGATQHLALAELAFPDGARHVVAVGEDAIVDGDRRFAPPDATWPKPQAILGFDPGSIAVATALQVYSAALGPEPLIYRRVRPAADAVALSSQIATALPDATGALHPAFVGLDVAGARLCAIDITEPTGAVCMRIALAPNRRYMLVAAGADVAIVEAAAMTTTIATYRKLVLAGNTLASAPAITADVPLTAPVVTLGPPVFALGIDGQTACLGMTGC